MVAVAEYSLGPFPLHVQGKGVVRCLKVVFGGMAFSVQSTRPTLRTLVGWPERRGRGSAKQESFPSKRFEGVGGEG